MLYTVYVPVTLKIAISFDDENTELTDKEVFEKAIDGDIFDWILNSEKADENALFDIDIEEMEIHEQIVHGNVFYGVINEYEVARDE